MLIVKKSDALGHFKELDLRIAKVKEASKTSKEDKQPI